MTEDTETTLIRTVRRQLAMTQEEFAHALAVTVSTVNRWENGHAEPSRLAWRAVQELARSRGLAVDRFADLQRGRPRIVASVRGGVVGATPLAARRA